MKTSTSTNYKTLVTVSVLNNTYHHSEPINAEQAKDEAIGYITKGGKLPKLLGDKYKACQHIVTVRSQKTGKIIDLFTITA